MGYFCDLPENLVQYQTTACNLTGGKKKKTHKILIKVKTDFPDSPTYFY